MAKKAHKNAHPLKLLLRNRLFLFLCLTLVLLIVSLLLVQLLMLDRIYPGVSVAQTSLAFLTTTEADTKLSSTLSNRLNQSLTFNYLPSTQSANLQQFSINLAQTSIKTNLDNTLSQALQYGHTNIFLPPVNLNLNIEFDPSLDTQIKAISKNIDIEPVDAKLTVEGDQIAVSGSQDGYILDTDSLKKLLANYVNTGKLTDNSLPIKKVTPRLSYQTALVLKKRLDQIKLAPLRLQFQDQQFNLSLSTIISFIDLENSQPSLVSADILGQNFNLAAIYFGGDQITDHKITLNSNQVKAFLETIRSQLDQPVEEPLFHFDPSSPQKVKEFRPPQEGRKLNLSLAQERITQALLTPNQTVINLPVDVVQPQNKLVNDLGIKELIGRGVSNFAGSIPNRIYNVNLTAQKLNGVLVPPGAVFSFDQTVGDITAATGFKQAYVIKSGRTVLDDGGGVCQDSTTLFRAVLNAGLPVLERTAHAYRVGYYEQGFPPGLDATVFYPSVDFKFKNDTDHHILIQSYTDGLTLYVDLYGTSDNRVSQVSRSIITDQVPPPPELRQDDPTLPKGTVKQVDFSAWGANVVFTRTVQRAGQTLISEKYYSNYRPWQAIYLVGTQ